jgi:RimJ/RimL family protein N-acetyltransferase
MKLRRATLEDAALLYQWRVEGEQADWYEGSPTSADSHLLWLAQRISTPLVTIWIVEVDDAPVGVVRLDSNDEISIEIAPAHRDKGYGTDALKGAVFNHRGRVKANVDWSNIRAQDAFEKAGFEHRTDVFFYLWKP